MKRVLFLGLVATAAGLGFAAVGAARPSVIVVEIFEHAVTDKTTDTGKKGDWSGNSLTFANPIYDGADKLKVGTDDGFCVPPRRQSRLRVLVDHLPAQGPDHSGGPLLRQKTQRARDHRWDRCLRERTQWEWPSTPRRVGRSTTSSSTSPS